MAVKLETLASVSQWRRSASAFSRTHPVRAFVVARVSRRRSALISQSRPRAAACAFRVRKCRVADETCTGGTSFFPSAGWQALAAPANRGIELSRLAPDSPPIPCRAHAHLVAECYWRCAAVPDGEPSPFYPTARIDTLLTARRLTSPDGRRRVARGSL